MKPINNIFFLIDTSGSMRTNGENIGAINYAMREVMDYLIDLKRSNSNITVNVILFSNVCVVVNEEDYCNDKCPWLDLETNRFKGRSNLGSAYQELNTIIQEKHLKMDESIIVLITDGEPTDNFGLLLESFDKEHTSKRLVYKLGKKGDLVAQLHTQHNAASICTDSKRIQPLLQEILELIV